MLKVYYLKISDNNSISEQFLFSKIEASTQKEIKAITKEQIRHQKCLGEAMSRELIESLWQLRPEDYSIKRTEHGKPYVQGEVAVFYNLSHSGDYLICAFSDQEVGIDIQQIKKEKPQLVERYFHPNEILNWQRTPLIERKLLFYRYWAAKESFLKYIGTGLSGSLSSFEILFTNDGMQVKKAELQKQPYLWSLEIDPDYQCCLCAASAEIPECHLFHF